MLNAYFPKQGGWGIRPARSLSEYQAALRDERCGLSRLGTASLWRVIDWGAYWAVRGIEGFILSHRPGSARCGLCVPPSGSASLRRCGLLHPAVAPRRTLGGVGSDLRPLQHALVQAHQSRLRAQPAPRRHDIHPFLTGRGDPP